MRFLLYPVILCDLIKCVIGFVRHYHMVTILFAVPLCWVHVNPSFTFTKWIRDVCCCGHLYLLIMCVVFFFSYALFSTGSVVQLVYTNRSVFDLMCG